MNILIEQIDSEKAVIVSERGLATEIFNILANDLKIHDLRVEQSAYTLTKGYGHSLESQTIINFDDIEFIKPKEIELHTIVKALHNHFKHELKTSDGKYLVTDDPEHWPDFS